MDVGFQLVMLIPFILGGTVFFGIQRFIGSFEEAYGASRKTTVRHNKGSVVSLSRKYGSKTDFHIRLIRENWLTRLLKRLGLSKEMRTGDRAFDALFYIVSDDPRTCDVFTAQKTVQSHLYSMVGDMDDVGWKFTEFLSDGDTVTTVFHSKTKRKSRDFGEDAYDRLLDEHISPVLEILEDPAVVSEPEPLDAAAKRVRKTTLFLSAAASILGLYVLYTLRAVDYWYVSRLSLLAVTAGAATLTVFLYAGYISRTFMGQSRIYALLLLSPAALFFSTFLGLYVFLRYSNVYLDESQPSYAVCTVQGKEIKQGRRSPRRYVLAVTHPFYFGERLEVNVPAAFYEGTTQGGEIELGIKKGFWGFAWIASLSLSPLASVYAPGKIRTGGVY